MHRALVFCVFLSILTIAGVIGCSDSTEPENESLTQAATQTGGTGLFRLYLVDSPGNYEAVNIVVTSVLVHRADEDSLAGWITVSAETDTVDLLQYADGTAFVLADTALAAGEYTQIRLMIGEGSHVMLGGEAFPLDIPSGTKTGLKIVHEFVVAEDGLFEATLDFDAHRSVHRTGHGVYKLTPVIRMVEDSLAGAIRGTVVPAEAVVMTIAGEDSVVAYPRAETGEFHLSSLPAGLYDVTIQPLGEAYLDSVITGVVVQESKTTDLGLIELRTP